MLNIILILLAIQLYYLTNNQYSINSEYIELIIEPAINKQYVSELEFTELEEQVRQNTNR